MHSLLIVLRIRPNLITKIRARDEAIEKRLHEIDDFFKRNALYGKLNHLLYGDHKWRWSDWEKEEEKNPLKTNRCRNCSTN